MGMKETHFLPQSKEDVLAYMRKNAYIDFDPDKYIDCLDFDPVFGGAYFLGVKPEESFREESEEGDYDDSFDVSIFPIRRMPEDDENGEPAYMLDWLGESDYIGNGLPTAEFLLSLPYRPDSNYRWRKEAWMNIRKLYKHTITPMQMVLGLWLIPSQKQTPLQRPNLLKRIDGTWNGWLNTQGVDAEHKRYNRFVKDDAIEDEAWEQYKRIVNPLKPMGVQRNDLMF